MELNTLQHSIDDEIINNFFSINSNSHNRYENIINHNRKNFISKALEMSKSEKSIFHDSPIDNASLFSIDISKCNDITISILKCVCSKFLKYINESNIRYKN